jgi:hypothetical protein
MQSLTNARKTTNAGFAGAKMRGSAHNDMFKVCVCVRACLCLSVCLCVHV